MDVLVNIGLLRQAIDFLAALKEADFDTLAESFAELDTLDLSAEECQSLVKDLSQATDVNEIFALSRSLDYLHQMLRSETTSPEQRAAELEEFLSVTGLAAHAGEKAPAIQSRLGRLLRPNPRLERREKLRWLRTGIAPTGIRFASFLDLRPNFDDARRDVLELVPVFILGVTTQDENGEVRTHTMQVTTEGFRQLQELLVDMDRKLQAIHGHETLSKLIRD